jgi:sugar (pentulose or hexulose) kinase
MRDVVTHMVNMGVAADSLLLLGGGARSGIWAQMRADIAGRPVDVPSCDDSATVGAAILAAVAGGLIDDLATAAASRGGDSVRLIPDRGLNDIYEAAYGNYRRLFGCLTHVFEDTPSGRVDSPFKRGLGI